MLSLSIAPLALGPFTSGWMLLWGLAAAVPIVLHFWNRRRRRTVSWAAMQFLAEAIQAHARRLRLWQILLLLLRVLAIVLIAFAVANPIFSGGDRASALTPSARLHVLVLDTSYSMQAIVEESTGLRRWERAQQIALEEMDRWPSGDAGLLVAMHDPATPVIAQATFDHDRIRASLDALQPTYVPADAEATLELIEKLIADAADLSGLGGGVDVTFFTDLQRPTWRPIARRNEASRWDPLDSAVTVRVVDVTTDRSSAAAEDPTSNLAVTELEVDPPLVFADQPARLETTLFASGQMPDRELAVRWTVDDALVASPSIAWTGTEQRTNTFQSSFRAGERTVTVEAGNDLLPLDNKRFLVFDVPEKLRVLCLGEPQHTRYVAAAMNPQGASWVDVTELPVSRIARVEEESFDVIMLCDLEAPSTRLVRWLAQSTRQGTGLLWWLGEAAEAEAYNGLQDEGLAELLPVQLNQPADFDFYAVDPRNYQHPIAAAFQDFPQSGLLSTPVFRYWQIDWHDETDSQPQVVLGIGTGSEPLLLSYLAPRHRVAVCTSAAASQTSSSNPSEEPWNALVAWPSFVPLVQETVRWLAAERFERPRYQVGDSLSGFADSERHGVQLVRGAAGEEFAVAGRQWNDGRWHWSTPPIPRPGIYRLLGPDQRVRSVAVNLDPSESDLTQVVGLNTPRREAEESSAATSAIAASPAAQGRLYAWLLWGAFAMLLGESLISRTMVGWAR